jgi:hypothetical protein
MRRDGMVILNEPRTADGSNGYRTGFIAFGHVGSILPLLAIGLGPDVWKTTHP